MSYKIGDRVTVVGQFEKPLSDGDVEGDNVYLHEHLGKSGTVIGVVAGVSFPTRVELDGDDEVSGFPFSDDELELERQDGFRIGTKVVVKTGTKGVHPKFNRNILSIQGLWHGAALVSNPEDDETATILLQDLAITEATR